MVDALALIGRYLLAGVFGLAATAKLRDQAGTMEALRGFGVPTRLVAPARYLLPAIEATISVLLLLPASGVVGGALALVLLGIFTAAIAVNLSQGRRPPCRCFGEVSSRPIGVRTLVRNFALMAVASYVLVSAPSTWDGTRAWFSGLSTDGQAMAVLGFLLLLAVALLAWIVDRLHVSHAALAERLDALAAGPPSGLPVGTEAPSFTLQTTEGASLSLSQLLSRGKPVILTFTDPNCGPCETLIPQVAMWQQSLRNVFTVGIVSRGLMQDNQAYVQQHGLSEVMVQEADELAELYGSAGTPSAVQISPDGTIDSDIVAGPDAIRELFERVIGNHAQSLWEAATGEAVPRPYAGLPIGTEVPEFPLRDLDGQEHMLREVVQKATMMVFWSPRCGFCHQIVDDARLLEARLPSDRQLVFLTAGTPEENRYMELRSQMFMDPGFELGRLFEAGGTPAALIVAEGRVVSGVEFGVEGFQTIARRFAGNAPSVVDTPRVRPRDN